MRNHHGYNSISRSYILKCRPQKRGVPSANRSLSASHPVQLSTRLTDFTFLMIDVRRMRTLSVPRGDTPSTLLTPSQIGSPVRHAAHCARRQTSSAKRTGRTHPLGSPGPRTQRPRRAVTHRGQPRATHTRRPRQAAHTVRAEEETPSGAQPASRLK